ncbi:MAG: Rha family transcriptional regulator [Candidatus Competibacter denitrificans]
MAKAKVAQHTTIANVIEVRHHKPMVSSLKIAELFERPHKNVLQAIRKELADEISRLEIKPSDYLDDRGKKQPLFWLDEAHALFVMPFIGGRRSREGQRALVNTYLYYREAYADPPRRSVLADKRAANHPMMEALVESRELQGKETNERHFMCESKLCNAIVSGRFCALEESTLSNDDAALLAKVRRRNESMLQVGFEYAERKKLLTEFAIRERTKRLVRQPQREVACV